MVEAAKGSRELPVFQGNGVGSGERIKVLLVDDHPMVREGMKRLLEGEGGFEVVGGVESVEEALVELDHEEEVYAHRSAPLGQQAGQLEQNGHARCAIVRPRDRHGVHPGLERPVRPWAGVPVREDQQASAVAPR